MKHKSILASGSGLFITLVFLGINLGLHAPAWAIWTLSIFAVIQVIALAIQVTPDAKN